MKKLFIILCCIALIMSSSSIGYCDSWLTDDLYNGHFIVDCFEKGAGSREWEAAYNYFMGVFQTIVYTKQSKKYVGAVYSKYTAGAIALVDVYNYYKNNPTQLSKPVIRVLMGPELTSGPRDK